MFPQLQQFRKTKLDDILRSVYIYCEYSNKSLADLDVVKFVINDIYRCDYNIKCEDGCLVDNLGDLFLVNEPFKNYCITQLRGLGVTDSAIEYIWIWLSKLESQLVDKPLKSFVNVKGKTKWLKSLMNKTNLESKINSNEKSKVQNVDESDNLYDKIYEELLQKVQLFGEYPQLSNDELELMVKIRLHIDPKMNMDEAALRLYSDWNNAIKNFNEYPQLTNEELRELAKYRSKVIYEEESIPPFTQLSIEEPNIENIEADEDKLQEEEPININILSHFYDNNKLYFNIQQSDLTAEEEKKLRKNVIKSIKQIESKLLEPYISTINEKVLDKFPLIAFDYTNMKVKVKPEVKDKKKLKEKLNDFIDKLKYDYLVANWNGRELLEAYPELLHFNYKNYLESGDIPFKKNVKTVPSNEVSKVLQKIYFESLGKYNIKDVKKQVKEFELENKYGHLEDNELKDLALEYGIPLSKVNLQKKKELYLMLEENRPTTKLSLEGENKSLPHSEILEYDDDSVIKFNQYIDNRLKQINNFNVTPTQIENYTVNGIARICEELLRLENEKTVTSKHISFINKLYIPKETLKIKNINLNTNPIVQLLLRVFEVDNVKIEIQALNDLKLLSYLEDENVKRRIIYFGMPTKTVEVKRKQKGKLLGKKPSYTLPSSEYKRSEQDIILEQEIDKALLEEREDTDSKEDEKHLSMLKFKCIEYLIFNLIEMALMGKHTQDVNYRSYIINQNKVSGKHKFEVLFKNFTNVNNLTFPTFHQAQTVAIYLGILDTKVNKSKLEEMIRLKLHEIINAELSSEGGGNEADIIIQRLSPTNDKYFSVDGSVLDQLPNEVITNIYKTWNPKSTRRLTITDISKVSNSVDTFFKVFTGNAKNDKLINIIRASIPDNVDIDQATVNYIIQITDHDINEILKCKTFYELESLLKNSGKWGLGMLNMIYRIRLDFLKENHYEQYLKVVNKYKVY